jgi:hypothetical protein
MTFVYNRRFWDTANLIEFKTGHPVNPSLFVTPDFAVVFVVTVERHRDTLSLRRLSTDETALLAARYGVEALQRVFPMSTDRRRSAAGPSWLGRLKFSLPMPRREWAAVGD